MLELWPRESKIWLKDTFKNNLVTQITTKFHTEKEKLALSLNEPPWLLLGNLKGLWHFRLGLTEKLCRVLNIQSDILFDNVAHIAVQTVRDRTVFLKDFEIDEEFAEWFGLWLGDGDHAKSRGGVGIGNIEKNIAKFHIKVLLDTFKAPKERIRVEVSKPDNSKIPLSKLKEKWSRILSIKKPQISCSVKKSSSNESARPVFWSRILFNMLWIIKPKVLNIIKGNEKLSRAFLGGIFSAEGSLRNKKVFEIRFAMAEGDMVEFSKELLNRFDIQTSEIKPNFNENVVGFGITGRTNFKRFATLIGFGHNSNLNKRMKELLLEMEKCKGKPNEEQFSKILSSMRAKDFITSSDAGKITKTSKFNGRFLLKKLVRSGIVKEDKNFKERRFSVLEEKVKEILSSK